MVINHVSLLFCFIFFAMTLSCSAVSNEDREVYIVYMGAIPEGGVYSPSSQHATMLQRVAGTSSVADSIVRSYQRSFNGFAAKLTKDEKQKLAGMKEVVSIFPNTILKPQTTRSWDFMGFKENVRRQLRVESDIIVGVIDTGVWPKSDSFKDDGFGPPPKKWKGACKGGKHFTCNKMTFSALLPKMEECLQRRKTFHLQQDDGLGPPPKNGRVLAKEENMISPATNKVIGARFYTTDSAIDDEGHGSHTASTAAGNIVKDASFYGIAKGTARGGVPSARIAVYKVCDPLGCEATDILAAFDDAIADGVDVISISIGGGHPAAFDVDTIAIGAFHAMSKGVLTSQSAGNSGPDSGTVVSVAPWILSVAANTFDRQIIDRVVLGNGKKFTGISVNSFVMNSTKVPIVYGKQVSKTCSEISAGACDRTCVDKSLVKGKIVLCDSFEGINVVYRAGGVGVISVQSLSPDSPDVVPFSASSLGQDDYEAVKAYHKSLKKPTAIITKSKGVKVSGAPRVASFSSRGPNTVLPDILKPDVTAPGVGIFAAYSPLVSPSSAGTDDPRRAQYNILSGTSMSCPHVAGLAAYVKSFHPHWPPSAIKSAIMTTAWPLNVTEQSDAVYDHGSGHINPLKAIKPGLVYETSKKDYVKMLCSAGYTDNLVKQISGDNSTTCKNGSSKNKTSQKDLNYPSMTATVPPNKAFRIKFVRTVTNVGSANSTYRARVSSNPKIGVKVVPKVLSFDALNEKKTFVVSVSGRGVPEFEMVSVSLTWFDGFHSVRSPIVAQSGVSTNKPTLV